MIAASPRRTVTWTDLRHEPFRLLFPLGAVYGIIGAGHWLVYALGASASYSGFFHASLQVGAYMSCFIVGFLLTAIPRFSARPSASTPELAGFLALLGGQAAALSAGWWQAAEAGFVGVLLLLAYFAGRRFLRRDSTVTPPAEFVWIPMSVLHGVAGSMLLIGAQSGWLPAWCLGVGRPMAQQGWLLGIILGIGGFMAPRLMGRGAPPAGRRRRRVTLHLVAGAALFTSFWIEGIGAIRLAYLLRAGVVTAELGYTARWWRPPTVRDTYVRLIWMSLWLLVIGLWGAGLLPRVRVAMLHVVFLGGISLLAFAVATMVVLSHTGEGGRLREPLWVLRVIAVGVSGALLLRLFADAVPAHFFPLLGWSAACWIAAAAGWLVFALPRVLHPLTPGAFERAHEEAQRRISA